MKKTKLMLGDNIQSLKKLPDNSIDSVVTDPPYGLSFMNKKWDYDVPSVEFWKEVWRVLKPGGHILSFGGTRTYHRMVVNIEDAGFEIRDQIQWIYGSGFPKSHNIGKAVDKIQGNEREVVGEYIAPDGKLRKGVKKDIMPNATEWDNEDRIQTKGTSEYEGWGTALKPANEPICLARKPLSEKSVAENVLKWGTGGLNIDGCRIEGAYGSGQNEIIEGKEAGQYGNYDQRAEGSTAESPIGYKNKIMVSNSEGRFPANIILDETAAELLDEQSGISKSRSKYPQPSLDSMPMNHYEETKLKHISGREQTKEFISDKGGASRFFYVAKVSKKERNMGLDHFEDLKIKTNISGLDDKPRTDGSIRETPTRKNTHPTIKPVNLMTYLCRLITPENGIVLDPYMGSGSTGIAALLEGFRFVGMEMDSDYFKIAESRIENWEKYRELIK